MVYRTLGATGKLWTTSKYNLLIKTYHYEHMFYLDKLFYLQIRYLQFAAMP